MRWILLLALTLSVTGCKFALRDFMSSVGEMEAETKGFYK